MPLTRYFLLASCFILLFHTRLSAQNPDTSVYHIRHNATGFLNKATNGNSYMINNNLRFNISKKHVSMNIVGGWIYGAQATGLTNNDYTAAMDFNLFKSAGRIYYWGLVTYDKSYSLKLTNRAQLGGGIGYTVVDNKDAYFVISDGPMYENSKLYDETMYSTVRNSFRLRYRFIIRKIIVIDGTNFHQQSVLDINDYIIKSNNTVSLKLNNWLSLSVAVNYNKLSATNKENLLCNFGFTFDRYF
jgi:hypothetical protein